MLIYNLKPSKPKQQLFLASMLKADGSLGIVARSLYAHHFTQAESLMFDVLSHQQRWHAS